MRYIDINPFPRLGDLKDLAKAWLLFDYEFVVRLVYPDT
jgi:hypothetical protein